MRGRLPACRSSLFRGLSPPPLGPSSSSSRTPTAQSAGVWPRRLCSRRSAAPHLSSPGPTGKSGVAARPSCHEVTGEGPQPHTLLPRAQGLRTRGSVVTLKLPLGAARKAVNTVTSGDRFKKKIQLFSSSATYQTRLGLDSKNQAASDTVLWTGFHERHRKTFTYLPP